MYTVKVLYSGDYVFGDYESRKFGEKFDAYAWVNFLNACDPPKSIHVESCGVTVYVTHYGVVKTGNLSAFELAEMCQ